MATRELAHRPAGAETLPDVSASWVAAIPEARRRHLRARLWVGAALTAGTLVVGGVTRLIESGLSIVDWAPIVGTVPPLNDTDWQEAFARYRQYPEYERFRPRMTLSVFKFISSGNTRIGCSDA